MTVNGQLFRTLEEYKTYLEEEWNTFTIKLYSLEDYLAMGEFVWNEETGAKSNE